MRVKVELQLGLKYNCSPSLTLSLYLSLWTEILYLGLSNLSSDLRLNLSPSLSSILILSANTDLSLKLIKNEFLWLGFEVKF